MPISLQEISADLEKNVLEDTRWGETVAFVMRHVRDSLLLQASLFSPQNGRSLTTFQGTRLSIHAFQRMEDWRSRFDEHVEEEELQNFEEARTAFLSRLGQLLKNIDGQA